MKRKQTLFLCLGAALITTALAGDFDREIKARQSFMQVLAYNNGLLANMVRGKVPYDAELAQTAALNLKLAAQMNMSSVWVVGSDMSVAGNDTKTKPELWSTWPKAGSYLTDLGNASALLDGVAGMGLEQMKAAFSDVGKACSACHKDFRAK
ncbi:MULTISPECIES: cytochrome c [Reinekea]|jgi:cytochrome c556|uniref:Cytochrome c-554 n=1 Tax=Reinekea forsetii TaxID=1336806 RepID=A0A2K8KUN2_9GAMM|nr:MULTISPECIES: cytochrome c [Reinekea]ATX78448.1 cytochrome c-554 [Reinekea forsetii]MDO7642420.1 cytochrome c [Reinekea forsetii]